jgi:hypothetical protein
MDQRARTYTMAKSLVWAAILGVGIVLLGAVIYMIYGSLEMHPTDEQQGKIRLVMAMVIATASAVQVVLWALLQYIRRREQPNSALLTDASGPQLRRAHGAAKRER